MRSSEQFSARERKVIELLLKGKSNKQMAVLLGVSARTIEFHLSNIYKKLKVSSRTEAVLMLSERYPRESTGTSPKAISVVSTVAKKQKLTKIVDNPFQLWRHLMPFAFYLLITLALLALLFGLWRLKPDLLGSPVTVVEQASATATTMATSTERPTSSPTTVATPSSSPTLLPTASSTVVSSSACKGSMPSHPAGPLAHILLVNATKANITISMFLALNKFGECGYSSYTLSRASSLDLAGVLPYGCYYTYAIINDPKRPTHVTSGPDCITEPDKEKFTVTYDALEVALAP